MKESQQAETSVPKGIVDVLKAMPGNLPMLADERSTGILGDAAFAVCVDVHLYVRPVDAYLIRTFVFDGKASDSPTRITNAKMLALDGLETFTKSTQDVIQVVSAPKPEPAPQEAQATPKPAKAPKAPKAAPAPEPAAHPKPPAAPEPPAAAEQPEIPAPSLDSDEPGVSSPDDGAPEWPHAGNPEDIVIVYGAANGQKLGAQTIDKLRWYSGTVAGRIRAKEGREPNADEVRMIQGAAYLVDLREWKEKRAGR